MMKILVIAEDLRISGTSEGQASRSFVYRMASHPKVEAIDLVYFRNEKGDHKLEMLPVNKSWQFDILYSKNRINRFLEKVAHKLFGVSLEERRKLAKIQNYLSCVNLNDYDHILVRSTGHSFLTLRACKIYGHFKNKIILFFHDPFPVYWDPGYQGPTTKKGGLNKKVLKDFLDIKGLIDIGFKCVAPSELLARDLRFLYRSKQDFFFLPHQFAPEVFAPAQQSELVKDKSVITIMYHGAIQLGREIEPFIDSVQQILIEYPSLQDKLKLIFRIKGNKVEGLKAKYHNFKTLQILSIVPTHIALWESKELADVNLIIEPSGNYSNILVGKAPLLDHIGNRILILGSKESELKRLLNNDSSFALADSPSDIKKILLQIILKIQNKSPKTSPFGDYFSQSNFIYMIDRILSPN